MDENKKRVKTRRTGRKFNILDLVIIVVVLFIIAVTVMLTLPKFRQIALTGKEYNIVYTVVFENVDNLVYDNIKQGQKVTDAESGRALGVVDDSPTSEDYYDFVLSTDADNNPTAVKNPYAGMGKNVTVVIASTAVYEEGKGYTVDGCRIAVGRKMELRFADFVGTGYCDGVEILAEN